MASLSHLYIAVTQWRSAVYIPLSLAQYDSDSLIPSFHSKEYTLGIYPTLRGSFLHSWSITKTLTTRWTKKVGKVHQVGHFGFYITFDLQMKSFWPFLFANKAVLSQEKACYLTLPMSLSMDFVDDPDKSDHYGSQHHSHDLNPLSCLLLVSVAPYKSNKYLLTLEDLEWLKISL